MLQSPSDVAESFWLRFWREPSQGRPDQWRGSVWHERQPLGEGPKSVRDPEEAFDLVRRGLGLPSGRRPSAGETSAFAPLRCGIARFLGLDPSEATFARRGFQAGDDDKRRMLETAGTTFVAGYNVALVTRLAILSTQMDAVAAERRGFFVEGAAMAAAITDSLYLLGRRLPELLASVEEDFVYLAHVGVGWALARVPWRRGALLAELDPLLASLAYDGCGFHDAYFWPDHVAKGYRRFGRQGYVARVYDQGVGRALWFVCGAEPATVARAIGGFAAERRPDLWAGVGLAATYVGGAGPEDCALLVEAAGEAHPALAQGATFAAEARRRAGCVPTDSETACRALTGLDVAAASDLVREVRDGLSGSDGADVPRYETWRHGVARALTPRACGLGG